MEQFFRLQGLRALVTGASSGLGAYFASVLATHGAEVVLAARRVEALEAVAGRLRDQGASVSTVILDVTDSGSRASSTHACGDVDILVNNAGVVRQGAALAQGEQDWDEVMNTNLRGMFFVAQAIARTMRDRDGGTIINVASILGLRQAGGVLPYAVSKAGVIQMTQSMALEWARYGIRVNALAPGYFETELNQDFWRSSSGESLIGRIPQRRLGKLPDLAGPLLLLASDASRYMTGATLAVDGGHLVSSLSCQRLVRHLIDVRRIRRKAQQR
jgi:NAD(P)-dependent dehydrogenase (short-subunit alcohol dehydrogenase family)